jgi:Fe(3+) dicitrate transport protein
VPLAYAPYGDNASYYHPPIERFETVELMKGAGQVQFGPQTIGGTVNYITPAPPLGWRGSALLTAGNRDFATGKLRLGGRRMLLDLTRKTGRGARDNMDSRLHDVNFKTALGSVHRVTLRGNYYSESSVLTYSGITQAELDLQGARYNPFRHDEFEGRRYGVSATQLETFGAGAALTTNLYYARFDRDWWRQSSTTTDTQGGPGVLAARLAGTPVDPDTIDSVQGRLRAYHTLGIEPRLKAGFRTGRVSNELQAGARAHFERQDRRQVNGTSPTARTGTVVEDNLRETRAYSAFVMDRVQWGAWGVSPGLRFEHVGSSRTNRLPGGASGSDNLDCWIPSLGVTWSPGASLAVFGGVHRGFAPPRTEDVISGSGTATDVEAEESTNWELGTRVATAGGVEFQGAAFRTDFQRLTAVGSIAAGSTPLAQGEALFTGVELSGRYAHRAGPSVRGTWTWVPVAEQSTPFRQLVGGAVIPGSAAGLRQPYAPEHMLTVAAGWARGGFDAQVEAVYIGSQFADFANTVAPSADGQRGRIEAQTTWNVSVNQSLGHSGARAFLSVKNLADTTPIVDRTRGIQVGAPRLVQGGLQWDFGG